MLSEKEESVEIVQLVDKGGKVLGGVVPELNLDKLISDHIGDPFTLKGVLEAYITKLNYTPLSIILTQAYDGMWHVIEGYANPKKRTFVVTMPITTFKPNHSDPFRPPTQAVNFALSAAVAKGVSIWIP